MRSSSLLLPAAAAVGLACALLGGCGLITGAETLVIDDDMTGGGGQGAGTTGTVPVGPGGAGTAGSGGGDNCAPCGPNEYCEASTGTCQCSPGFVLQG